MIEVSGTHSWLGTKAFTEEETHANQANEYRMQSHHVIGNELY